MIKLKLYVILFILVILTHCSPSKTKVVEQDLNEKSYQELETLIEENKQKENEKLETSHDLESVAKDKDTTTADTQSSNAKEKLNIIPFIDDYLPLSNDLALKNDQEEDNKIDKEKRYQDWLKIKSKYEKLFSQKGTWGYYFDEDLSEEELNSTLEKKVNELRIKINPSENKTSNEDYFLTLYNPLGYSIDIPQNYRKSLSNSNLWHINYEEKDSYEIQIFIGLTKNEEIELENLLDKIKKRYDRLTSTTLKWQKTESLTYEKRNSTNVTEGIKTSAIDQLDEFRNFFYIEVVRGLDKKKITFLIGILSVNTKLMNYKQQLKYQETIFWKIVNSFTFI